MGKTHKPECPLRVIISERGSWKNEVSTYLQRILTKLILQDPFLVRSSTELVQALVEGQLASVNNGFSIDVQDLFYSVPQQGLFRAVRETIEASGELEFHNSAGMTTEQFLEVLEVYLKCTIVCFNDLFYVQKGGI
ncbi:hypothetical protein HPB48_013683 [Haemaphysalis longicornis]|uniref:Reverse transcriptase domain-containing protein n=1 Tax=Haemaphysalis longicornis TaxID=44386 RepID=A0A9J6FW74_HAELO|nr:hypothetical protein HPB48_013683 [Haemaphysalis longicornis]